MHNSTRKIIKWLSKHNPNNDLFVALNINFQKINQKLTKEKTNEYLKFTNDSDTKRFDIRRIEKAVINGVTHNNTLTWDMIEYNPQMQKAYWNIGISELNDPITYALYCDTSNIDYICTDDMIKGNFALYERSFKIDSFDGTISGLSNGVGGYIEIKSDDGKFYMKAKLDQYKDRSFMAPGAAQKGNLTFVSGDQQK